MGLGDDLKKGALEIGGKIGDAASSLKNTMENAIEERRKLAALNAAFDARCKEFSYIKKAKTDFLPFARDTIKKVNAVLDAENNYLIFRDDYGVAAGVTLLDKFDKPFYIDKVDKNQPYPFAYTYNSNEEEGEINAIIALFHN